MSRVKLPRVSLGLGWVGARPSSGWHCAATMVALVGRNSLGSGVGRLVTGDSPGVALDEFHGSQLCSVRLQEMKTPTAHGLNELSQFRRLCISDRIREHRSFCRACAGAILLCS